MMAALRDYRNIWRVTMLNRGGLSRPFRVGVALLLLAATVLLVGNVIWGHKPFTWDLARVLLGLVTFWFALMGLAVFLPGSFQLNTAVNARLLPRQRRRIVQMFVGGWLLLSAAVTVVVGRWAAFPVCAAYFLVIGVMAAGNMYAWGLMILAGNWSWLSRYLLPPAPAEAFNGDMAAAALMVLLVPAGVWGVRWMYPAGGDVHFERRSKQARRLERAQGSGWAEHGQSRGGMFNYAAALRRDCRTADPGRMLLHALGPAAHWSAWIGSGAVMLAIAVVMGVIVWGGSRFNYASLHGISIAWLGGLLLAILFSTAQFSRQMKRTVGEQALLRLTPLAGDAASLNRRLAAQLLQGALFQWIGMTAVIVTLGVLAAGKAILLMLLALCCLAGQVAMMGLLGDYARAGGWNPMLGLGAAVLAVLQFVAAVVLGRLSGIPVWPWLMGVAIATCAFQLSLGWQRMLAAPPAFPAQRMA